MSKRPPNIFVFMSDQEQSQVVRDDHPCITPCAQKLAEEGLRFDYAYTPTAHSCPARGTYFTGLYPSVHGVWNNVNGVQAINGTFDPSLTMFSESMRAAAWNLGITGKWHCSNVEDPHERGWDEVRPTALSGNRAGVSWDKWSAMAEEEWDDSPRKRGEIINPGYGRHLAYSTTDQSIEDIGDYKTVTAAIEAMEQYVKEDKPFFIHCGPGNPHDAYNVPREFVEMYDLDDVPLPANYHDDLQDKPRIYQRQAKLWAQLSEEEVRESVLHYWADCTMVDALRQMVYDAIDRLGIRDNTIFIVTSDHGDYAGSHGLYCKGVPSFDEAQRIPLIVRWPDGIENPGRVIDDFVTLADYAPTFLEVAGLPQNPTHGASLTPFFKSNDVDGWTDEYYNQMSGVEVWYTQRFVQTKQAKYVYNAFDFDELYDLEKDPLEMKNLVDDPAYQDVKLEMVKRMWKQGRRTNDITTGRYHTVALAPWGPAIGLKE